MKKIVVSVKRLKPEIRFQIRIAPEGKMEYLSYLAFRPIDGVPGYTHRIWIGGECTNLWLADGAKVNRKTATFFMEKWLAQ